MVDDGKVTIRVSREIYDSTRATLEAGMTRKGECEKALQALGAEAACTRPIDVFDVVTKLEAAHKAALRDMEARMGKRVARLEARLRASEVR